MKYYFIAFLVLLYAAPVLGAGDPKLVKISSISEGWFRPGFPATFIATVESPAGDFRGGVILKAGSVAVERRIDLPKGSTLRLVFRVPLPSARPELELVFLSEAGRKTIVPLKEFASSLRELQPEEMLFGVVGAPAPAAMRNWRFVKIPEDVLSDPAVSLEVFDAILLRADGQDRLPEGHTENYLSAGGRIILYDRTPDVFSFKVYKLPKRNDIIPGIVEAAAVSLPPVYSSHRKLWGVLLALVSAAFIVLILAARKCRRAWAAVLPAVLLVILSYLIFRFALFTPTPVRAVTLSLRETAAGGKSASERVYIGLSAARGRTMHVLPAKVDTIVDEVTESMSGGASIMYLHDDRDMPGACSVAVDITPGSLRILRRTRPARLDGAIDFEHDRKEIRITNACGSDLKEAFLTDFSEARSVGSLPFGRSQTVPAKGQHTGFQIHVKRFAGNQRNSEMILSLLDFIAGRRRGSGVVYLIALSENTVKENIGPGITDRSDGPTLWIIRTDLASGSW
ncbi:MAG: hypothetical protein E3J72_16290 [Planctomycetota bacterium]|nr:MAG: hypothetical protein E3J72_16290 [Planctomycetota bacterium]